MNGFHTQESYLNYVVTKPEKIKSMVTQLSISGVRFIINNTLGGGRLML